jgi:type IV pilus assembly protein PilX
MKRYLTSVPKDMHSQRGVALIISLILLTVMSLVGMSAVRAISKEERMVSQSLDRNIAFQATESALREAEAWIETTGRPTLAAGAACSDQGSGSPQLRLCGAPSVTATVPRWIDVDFTSSSSGWKDATPVGTGNFVITPQYFVEYLGDGFPCQLNDPTSTGCKRYRVSARPKPINDRATVVLQTVYSTYEP